MGTLRDNIETLCRLQRKAFDHLYPDGIDTTPCDCFCGRGSWWRDSEWPNQTEYYRNDGAAIRFIVEAVEARIAEEARREASPA